MTRDDDGPDFDPSAFNAGQRDWAADPLLAVPVEFPCWSCGRSVSLDELEQHGYDCEECHHARRDTAR